MKMFYDVLAFQYKFGVLPQKGVPHFPSDDVIEFRKKFLQEELDEFKTACAEGNMEKAIDALLDLSYVINGTALLFGITPECWNECWDEVQRANMTKVRANSAADSRSKRGHSLDVVKPEGWRGPNHLPILQRHGYE
jgi:predicted HAD superfamily Cof-like phosphohydrolase